MKLAKKTLSVALAAIMAASSLAGATTAFAADYLEPSKPAYKAVSVGTTTVTPDVKIDTKYATDSASGVDKQIDETSLNNYYSFTPSVTGEYSIKLESTALYYGWNQKAYLTAEKQYDYITDSAKKAEKLEKAAHVYSTSLDGMFTDTTFATKLTAADAKDTVTISNVATEDAFLDAAVTTTSKDVYNDKHVLSYKYDAAKEKIVEDSVVKTTSTGKHVETKETYLKAGTTYYFMVTVANQGLLVKTEEVKRTDGKTYVEASKSDVKTSAKLTISKVGYADGLSYSIDYTDVDAKGKAYTQKVTVPDGYTAQAGETKELDIKTQKFYVEKIVEKKVATAYNNGGATTVKVADTVDGANVTKFVNYGAALTTVTLGKYVEAVEGLKDNGVDKVGANVKNVTITNPDFVVSTADFNADAKMTVPSNSVAYASAARAGFVVNVVCAHANAKVVKAATVFAAGSKQCEYCGKTVAIDKLAFKPTFKAKKGAVEVKGNAGKVAKVAVWVDGKKTVKKNVTKCTVKKLKAGKHVVKVKLYDANGNKTASVKKTVKVK